MYSTNSADEILNYGTVSAGIVTPLLKLNPINNISVTRTSQKLNDITDLIVTFNVSCIIPDGFGIKFRISNE